MVSPRSGLLLLLFLLAILLLLILELVLGSASIGLQETFEALFKDTGEDSSWQRSVVLQSRLPRALTAMLSGAGLALSGLLLQTLFRNPLAGPSVLGITSGSGLGVALLLLGSSALGLNGFMPTGISISMAAIAGALGVLLLIMLVAVRLKDQVALLIFGLMIGYLSSGLVSVLQFGADKEALRAMVFWGFGTFGAATWSQIGLLAAVLLPSILFGFGLIKPLNALLLGSEEAEALGLNYKRMRLVIILFTGVMTGAITACCGPIAFLGLAVPHLVRGLWKTANHLVLVPAVILCGAGLALACDLISRMPWSDQSLPLNAVTSLIGAPVVIHIILRGRKMKGFF